MKAIPEYTQLFTQQAENIIDHEYSQRKLYLVVSEFYYYYSLSQNIANCINSYS